MKRIKVKVILVSLIMCSVIILIFGLTAKIKNSSTSYLNNSEKELNTDGITYKAKEYPTTSLLLSKDIISQKVKEDQKSGILKSIELKTWKEHNLEDDPECKTFPSNIENDRLVWVTKNYYPLGTNTRAGFYENATVFVVYDAVTGDPLKVFVHGDFKANRESSKK